MRGFADRGSETSWRQHRWGEGHLSSPSQAHTAGGLAWGDRGCLLDRVGWGGVGWGGVGWGGVGWGGVGWGGCACRACVRAEGL